MLIINALWPLLTNPSKRAIHADAGSSRTLGFRVFIFLAASGGHVYKIGLVGVVHAGIQNHETRPIATADCTEAALIADAGNEFTQNVHPQHFPSHRPRTWCR